MGAFKGVSDSSSPVVRQFEEGVITTNGYKCLVTSDEAHSRNPKRSAVPNAYRRVYCADTWGERDSDGGEDLMRNAVSTPVDPDVRAALGCRSQR